MNTRTSFNLSTFLASPGANNMASSRYSDCPWSEAAACNDSLEAASKAYLTANQLNLMSRFSLNSSSLALNLAAESDATSSSASSSSATNNSSNSLSASPAAIKRDTPLTSLVDLKQQQTSNHLLELQKEIKEEEEEIFADINSLINSRSNLYSTLGIDDNDDDSNQVDDGINPDDETDNLSLFKYITSLSHDNSNLSGYHNLKTSGPIFRTLATNRLIRYQSSTSDDTLKYDCENDNDESGCAFTSKDDQSDAQTSEHQSATDNNRLPLQNPFDHYEDTETVDFQRSENATSRYLQEHIEENVQHKGHINHEENSEYMIDHDFTADYDQNDQPDYQALQAVIQQVTSNLPKPCVFFLEGNCRRSDCKYSHDLSNITCKYWIEGFCFKGEMCPFLHSYTSQNDSHDSGLFDENGLKTLTKTDLNPTFVIESEADFPSLPLDAPTGTPNETAKSGFNNDVIANTIKSQILSSNPSVVFKTVKKKRKKG